MTFYKQLSLFPLLRISRHVDFEMEVELESDGVETWRVADGEMVRVQQERTPIVQEIRHALLCTIWDEMEPI